MTRRINLKNIFLLNPLKIRKIRIEKTVFTKLDYSLCGLCEKLCGLCEKLLRDQWEKTSFKFIFIPVLERSRGATDHTSPQTSQSEASPNTDS